MSAQARLDAQMAFLMEADRLKTVLRATPIADNSRRENSAEHSWHLALFALVLGEHGADVSIDRVIRMLLLHDLVEIDAGDVPVYGEVDSAAIAAREQAAADRLFGLLPADQGAALRALWDEFEASETPDAIFAKSLDRVQPVVQNLASGGGSWIDYEVSYEQLEARVGHKVARGAPALWDWVNARARIWFGR